METTIRLKLFLSTKSIYKTASERVAFEATTLVVLTTPGDNRFIHETADSILVS
jgi:hypothetical protein